jgi:hypothetical protein
LKQNKTNESAAPIRSSIPIANPAFPAVLIPPELELAEGVVVALAAEIEDVEEVWASGEVVVVWAKSDESVG